MCRCSLINSILCHSVVMCASHSAVSRWITQCDLWQHVNNTLHLLVQRWNIKKMIRVLCFITLQDQSLIETFFLFLWRTMLPPSGQKGVPWQSTFHSIGCQIWNVLQLWKLTKWINRVNIRFWLSWKAPWEQINLILVLELCSESF